MQKTTIDNYITWLLGICCASLVPGQAIGEALVIFFRLPVAFLNVISHSWMAFANKILAALSSRL
jgi:hypothetical protein